MFETLLRFNKQLRNYFEFSAQINNQKLFTMARPLITEVEKILNTLKVLKAIRNHQTFNAVWYEDGEANQIVFAPAEIKNGLAIYKATFTEFTDSIYTVILDGTRVFMCISQRGRFSKFKIQLTDLVYSH